MNNIESCLTVLQQDHLLSVFNPWVDYDPELGISPSHLPHPANGHANQFRAAVREMV